MDDRLTGSILIFLGLIIATGLGGTMSDIYAAIFYIVGFLMAFLGLGLLLKYRREKLNRE